MSTTLGEIALVMFIGMGPIKVLIFYLGAVREADAGLGRRVAIRAVLTATVTTAGLLVTGALLMRLLHFSPAALVLAGGVVLLAYGLQMVLSTTPGGPTDRTPTEPELMRMAIYPMGVPLILNPAGVAAATIFSAEAASLGELGVLVAVVLAIAVLDVVVLLAARPLAGRIAPEATTVLEKLLGVLLSAVAVELLLFGLGMLGLIAPVTH